LIIQKKKPFCQNLRNVMFILKKYKLFSVLVLLLLFIGQLKISAQLSDREKAQWIILNIAQNTSWTNESTIRNFTIAVYGYSGVYNELVKQSSVALIKGKSFTVVQYRRIKDIGPAQVLFIPQGQLENLQNIRENVAYNTLFITDECPFDVFMIDFTGANKSNRKIDINTRRAKAGGISFNDRLIEIGGREEDLKRIYSSIEKRLQDERRKLEKQRAEFSKQEEELGRLQIANQKEIEENKRQKEINKQQKIEIENQKGEIELQKEDLTKVQEDLEIQQIKLNYNNKILKNQEGKIKTQLDSVEKSRAEIEKQDEEIRINQELIASKVTNITEQDDQIKFQRFVIVGFSVLLVFIVILAYFIWRGYKVKQKINDELRDKNIAINKQREEIFNQNQQTELLNKELEKLSIVAAQTDNAVTIMDKVGNFEWVNVGYTRMYGYTLQLLKNERGENLMEASTEERIRDLFEKCKTEKKTMVYETLNKTRAGKDLWIQISLTPILDAEGNISKLITVGTDINRIKKAEREIRAQHKKILDQTVQLEATNKELEKLSLVASETDNAISIMDAAGNFQWINDGYSRLYGYSYNQLVSEYSGNIITKGLDPEVKVLIKKCIEEQVPVSYENLRSTRGNEKVWVQTTLTPITDKEGNPRSIISISQNISKLKSAEQAIRQQSEELMAQKEELIIQKDQVEQLNENILASIGYAKTIQSAILPPEANLNKDFKSFIIYKPKDIVSGDFYWHSFLPAKNGGQGKHFIAAVDCTGHGVPGAFMSMIGSRLLNEIVKEKGVDRPSQILDRMNSQIKRALRQEKNENNDGMDVCLCSIEHTQNGTAKMVFSGAKRPLYFYSQQERSLKYIKGTRKTIGGTQAKRNQEVFIDHEVMLDKGDLLYLTTDGIIDQPSPDRIRFGSVRFINLLKSIGNQPIEIQKQIVEESVREYQGQEQQRDDVTFIGVKV